MATEAGVETQSVSATDALQGGELTGAVDIENNPIEIPATGEITFIADGKPQGVVPTEVTMAAGSATKKVPLNDFEYDLEYYIAKSDFTNTGHLVNGTGSAPIQVGKYIAKLTINEAGDYYGATISVPFEIKAATLEGVSVVDTVDGSFEFDGLDQLDDMAFMIGDKYADMSQFTVVGITYKKGDKFPSEPATDAIYPGDYSMVIRGNAGTIYAGSETEVKFTVTPLDLSKATIVINDVVVSSMGNGYEPTIESINGDKLLGNPVLDAEVMSVFKSGPEGSNLVWKRGEYTYTVTAATSNGYVENSKDVTFVATDSDLAHFMYQGAALPGTLNINLSNGESFTPDKIQAFKADGSELNDGEYTVTVKNLKTGAGATLADVNTPGSWLVTVKVNAAAMDYTLGGSASMTVNTIAGSVETSANIYFIYDGKIVSGSTSVEYDGSDKLDGLQVVVTDTYGNVLAEGKDYTVTAYDKAGNKVDQVVDAGTYTVEVTSDAYNIVVDDATGATLTLVVDPVSVYDLRVARDAFVVYGKDAFLPYTGSAITPGIEYKDSEGEWHALPSDLYTLTYAYSEDYSGTYKKVDEMAEEGYYKIYLHAVRDNDPNWGLKNDPNKGFWQVDGYEAANKIVRVTASRLFADVANNTWYSQPVYDAVDMGYMNGYNGTSFFGPEDSITRGQVACVLFNMAGGEPIYDEEWFDKNVGTNTPFDDVDPNAYYARAIAWAAKAGVVNGYQDGTFHPDQAVSAQEFACMLANYAKATGVDVDAAEADLSEYPGGDQVADFATESMEWAVSEGIMGNNGANLAPTSSIMRCRVAAMAVNFQPDGAFDSVFEFSAKE